jgi:hypothetical protein
VSNLSCPVFSILPVRSVLSIASITLSLSNPLILSYELFHQSHFLYGYKRQKHNRKSGPKVNFVLPVSEISLIMTEPVIKLPEPKGVAEAIVLSSQLQSHYDLGSDLDHDLA